MGKVQSMKNSFFRSRVNGKNLRKKNGDGNGKNPVSSRKVLFEPMEPRVLLSSDLAYTGTAAFDLTLRYDDPTHKLQLIDNATSTAVLEQDLGETTAVTITGSEADDRLTIDFSSPFTVPGGISFIDGTDSDHDTLNINGNSPAPDMTGNNAGTINSGGGVRFNGVESLKIGLDSPSVATGNTFDPSFTQVFYLDLDGAKDVTYKGPVTISDISMPEFGALGSLQGQEADIISSMLSSLDQMFSGLHVVFTTEQPAAAGNEYSTIYIGGDDSAFSDYGPFIGISEKIDKGNQDHSDDAFVFSNEVDTTGFTAAEFGSVLAGYVSHEAGHLMGMEHAYQVEAGNPLSAVGFKPYVHIEIAKDVRNDLIADGKLTIAGKEYEVNPLIVEAITKYPAYYYAGAVGPDGFPELVMGQTVLHPDSTGIWVGHILDMAWEAQKSDTYTPEEKLQILAWAFGFPTHVAGDVWSHTLIGEFSGGPWPEVANIATTDVAKENVMRHLIVENYIADATAGFDGIKKVDDEVQRTQLPDGDVSDNSTPECELKVPTRFIYEALINNIPDLPGQKQEYVLTTDFPAEADLAAGTITANLKSLLQNAINADLDFTDRFIISSNAQVSSINATTWEVKNDYTYLELKKVEVFTDNITGQNSYRLELYKLPKSRGPLIDAVIMLREQLVRAADSTGGVGPVDPAYDPFRELVDGLLEKGDQLLRGDGNVALEQIAEDLKALGLQIVDSFKILVQKLMSGVAVSDLDLINAAASFGDSSTSAANTYLNYWIGNIDRGLEHWGDFGLALSRAFFDPQSKRDLQNAESGSYGPDVVNPDFKDSRGDQESSFGLIDVILNELEDPNNDEKTDDSFINQYLLPMFGIPQAIGDLRAGLDSFMEQIQEKVLDPMRELAPVILQPIDELLNWLKKQITDYVKEEIIRPAVYQQTGVDIEVLDFILDSPSGLMDVESISMGGTTLHLFSPTDHEKLDAYLGFTGDPDTYLKPFGLLSNVQTDPLGDGTISSITFNDNAHGGLLDNVEFDKQKFGAYANSVVMSKMLLFQELLVDETPVDGHQPKTISKLLSDLTGQPYDFEKMTLNGHHGGNIMTATMPGVTDEYGQPVSVIDKYGQPVFSDLWLTSIDWDHTWRQDSQTGTSSLYHYTTTNKGNSVEWKFTGLANGTYKVQTDWLLNIAITDQGNETAATNATYVITSGGAVKTVSVDQNVLPNEEIDGQCWYDLTPADTIEVTDGTLTITLADAADGDFIVAGRARIRNTDGSAARIITNQDAGYTETAPTLIETGLSPADVSQLDLNQIPDALRALFTNFSEQDFRKHFSVFAGELKGDLSTGARNPFAQAIWDRLSSGTQQLLTEYFLPVHILDSPSKELREALLNDLNESVITGASLYDALSASSSYFKDLKLSGETLRLQGKSVNGTITAQELLRLNHLLLEDAYPAAISKNLSDKAVVKVVDNGTKWIIANVEIYEVSGMVSGVTSERTKYTEVYTIEKGSAGFSISRDWQGIKYASGTGNFPLWESSLLRDKAFRTLFKDWENGGQQFPDLGDDATQDPNESNPPSPITFGQFPAYTEYVPNIVAQTPTQTITVSGHQTEYITGDITNLVIIGDDTDDTANPDILELIFGKDAVITGSIFTSKLENLIIRADESITLEDGATISSRQISGGGNYWDAASIGDSGDITLIAPEITIGAGANILAHTEPGSGFLAGDILFTAADDATLDHFLGIDDFKWQSSEATVDIGMGARLTGNNITITSSATTVKNAELDRDIAALTKAVVLGDANQDGIADLMVVGNYDRPNQFYVKDANGNFVPAASGTNIDVDPEASHKTTSMAMGFFDGDLELLVGTENEGILLYKYTGSKFESLGAISGSAAYKTTALALNDIDGDGSLELLAGTDGQGIIRYDAELHFFTSSTVIDSTPGKVTSLALGDVNNDTKLDLIAGRDELTNRLYLNTGDGTFAAAADIDATAYKTTSVALGDVNKDGKLDLVVGNDGQTDKLYLNDGNGGFQAGTDINATASRTTAVALGDVDHDGNVDLVVGNYGESNRLYLNNGAGGFGDAKNIPGDALDTTVLALGNIDADQDLELLVGHDKEANVLYQLDRIEGAPAYIFGQDIVSSQIAGDVKIDELGVSNHKAVALDAESDATIAIGAGAVIRASNNVSFDATAHSEARLTTKRGGWGVTYGSSSPTAEVTVENGVVISAGNQFQMHATTTNNLNVITVVPSLGEKYNISVSLARAHSNSLAEIDNGAEITAGSADILAENHNSFLNTAVASGFGTSQGESAGYAITVALGYYQSSAMALVSGIITTSGDLNIAGRSINDTNTTRTYAAVNGNPAGPVAEELGNFTNSLPFEQKIGDKLMKFKTGATQSGYAFGLGMVTSDNVANALIGQGAFITVGGNLTLTSYAEDSFQVSAAGTAGEMSGSNLQSAVAGALVYSKVANRSNAFVEWNADVDVAGTLTLDSDANIISPVDPMQLALSMLGFGEWTSSSGLQAYLSTLTDQLKTESDSTLPGYMDYAKDENKLGTSYLYAGGSASTSGSGSGGGSGSSSGSKSVGGGLNFQYMYNASNAAVAKGSRINQRRPGTAAQNVVIDAHTSLESVNIAGNISVLNYVTNKSDKEIGGFFDGIFCQNFSNAYIDDLAVVSAGGDVTVNATSDNKLTTIVVAGGFAEQTGIDGAVAFNRIKNSTLAYIEDRATVIAGHDITLNADSDLRAITVAPAISSGGNWGVGISASFTDIQDETVAFIGNLGDPDGPGGYGGVAGSVTAGHNLSLAANSAPELWSIAASSGSADGNANNTDNGSGGGITAGGTQSGYGLSGSVAFNWLDQNTLAFIRDNATVSAGNSLILEAESLPLMVSVAGAFGDGKNLGIGGSYAHNELSQNTKAFMKNADITAGTIQAHAHSDNDAVAVAGSYAGSKKTASVAGAVTNSIITTGTNVYIGDDTEVISGNISLQAQNKNLVAAFAGGLARGSDTSSVSAGASVNLGSVDAKVYAWIAGTANVDASGDVLISASNDDLVGSVAVVGATSDQGIGADGSAVLLDVSHDVQAFIADGSTVDAEGSLYIDADDKAKVFGVTGQYTSAGGSAGFGVSVTDLDLNRNVKAFIGAGANVKAKGSGNGVFDPEGTLFGGSGITLDATSSDDLYLFAAGGTLSGNATVGVAGSAIFNTMNSDTQAYIGAGAIVNADNTGADQNQSVRLRADDDTHILDGAGNIADAKTVAVGAAADIEDITKNVSAHIDSQATVNARKDVILSASSDDDIISLAAAGTYADTASIAGSASVVDIDTTTEAWIQDTASTPAVIDAGGDVTISADGTFSATMIAGAVGLSSSVGIGASNTTLLHTDAVRAYVGDGVTVNTGGAAGLTVQATSSEELITIAAGVAVSDSVSVAGSAVVNDLNETTLAYIGRNANIAAQDIANNPGVLVSASDETTIVSVAGSLAASGSVAVGLGADVGLITKTTKAYIDSGTVIDADGDIKVNAQSMEDITSVAAGLGASDVAIGIDASVHVLTVTTKGFIGDEDGIGSAGAGHVHAQGDVIVAADDNTEVDKVVGVLAAGCVGVGAAGAVTVTDKTTEAFIGQGAWVTGEGLSAGNTVHNGRFTPGPASTAPTFDPNNANGSAGIETSGMDTSSLDIDALKSKGDVKTPQLADMNADQSSDGSSDTRSDSLTRTIQAGTQDGFHGVAVSATNRDDIADFTVSFAGGSVGVAVSAGVNVIGNTTSAYIGENAAINADTSAAGAQQSVLVAAGSDFKHMAVAGSIGVGYVGVSPAVDVTVVSNSETDPTAEASIRAGAVVNAKNDVTVEAHAREDVLLAGFGIAAGVVGVGGAVNVLVIDNFTVAKIAGTVFAGGDVLVYATDDTSIDVISGALAAGFVGVGGSVGVITVDKATQAYIADGATVDALGNGDGLTGILDGTNDGTNFGTTTAANAAHGLIVQAQSTEDFFHLAVAAGFGFVGVSGGVAVTLIDSNTDAYIGNASINQSDSDSDGTVNEEANANQSVIVNASNKISAMTFAGAVAGGFVGVGGAVDVGTIKNDVSAGIRSGAAINAANDVDVYALGIKDVDGYAFSGAGGLVGLSASISVWSIGSKIDKNYSDNDGNSADATTGNNGSADNDAAGESQAASSQVAGMLGGFSGSGGGNNSNADRVATGTSDAGARLSASAPSQSAINGTIASTPPDVKGTEAYIQSGATIKAGSDINVKANEHVDAEIFVGGMAGGLVGIGAGISVVNIAANSSVHVAGTLSAAQSISVESVLVENVDVTGVAAGVGFVGLGAAVVVIHDSSVTDATLSGTVTKAASVSVSADSVRNLTDNTAQVTAGVVAAGASFTRLTVDGDTTASVGNNTQIGQLAGSSVGSLSVTADADIDAQVHTKALAVGAVAISANFAFVDINSDVTASIGNNAKIKLTGAVLMHADGEMNSNADVLAPTGGLGATGASIGRANITSNVSSVLGDYATINTSGNITIESWFNHDGTAATDKKAQATAVAPSFAGLSVTGTSSTAHNSGSSEAKTGTGSSLSGNNVNITALSSNVATTDNDTLSVGLLTAIGLSSNTSTADGTTRADVEGAVTATGNVTIRTNATATTSATAEAPTAGLGISGVGTEPDAQSVQIVESKVGTFGAIQAGGAISITATLNSTATATAKALSIGTIAIGASQVTANAGGSVESHMDGTISAGASLTITSTGTSDADATTEASSGSLAGSANFAQATATASPTIKAYKDGTGNVTLSGSMSLTATSDADADARAKGLSIGLVGADGSMQATSVVSPTVDTHIGGGTITTTNGGGITLTATHNYGASGALSDHGATAWADAAGGGILVSGQGAVPTATANADVNASVGSATLNAAAGIAIDAKASNVANADADAVSVGLGILGKGASIATAGANGTTKAHMDGAVTGGTFLTIAATGYSDADATAEASGGGLLNSTTPHASATASPTVKAYKDGSGNVTVSGTVGLSATSDSDADAAAKGLSVGLAGAEGTMKATAIVSPILDTHINGGTITAGSITLLSKHNHDTINPLSSHGASASADAAGGAFLVSGQGAVPTATANAAVDTYVGTGAVLNAGLGDISISSFASNTASAIADADSFGILGKGASIANATAGGSTKARMDGSIHGATAAENGAGSLTLLSQVVNSADAKAEASSGGLLNVTVPVANATVSPTIVTRIGNDSTGASVRVSGAVTVQSIVETNAVANAPAFTVGLVAGVGVTDANASISPTIDTFIGSNSSVSAGSILLESLHNYTAGGSVVSGTFMLGSGYITDAKGAHAKANASGGGLIGYNSATATATANADVQTYIKGTTISAGGAVTVRTRSNNDADAESDGDTYGLAGVGTVTATANANGTAKAYISGVSSLSGSSLTVLAKGTNDADASTDSASGGLISGRESLSYAYAGPTVEAYASSASSGIFTLTDAASITALAVGDANSTAEGDSGGIGSFGESKAVAQWTPNVDAYLGPQTTLTAGGNVLIQAFNNYDFNESTLTGTKNTSKLTQANAKSSVGGLVGVTGSEAGVTVTSNVDATVKAGASVTSTNGSVTLTADSRNNAKSKADGQAYGAIGIGKSTASATLNNGARATTENGTTSDQTELHADSGNIYIHSDSDTAMDVDAIGGGDGLVSVNEAAATANMQSDTITSSIGSCNAVTAGDLLELLATRNADIRSDGKLEGDINVVDVTDAKANAYISNAAATVSIGSYTTVDANRVMMIANDNSVYAEANARSSTDLTLYANFDPVSTVSVNTSANAYIGTGAQITGTDSVQIWTNETGVRSRSYAFAKVGAGAASNLIVTANNTRTSASNITTEAGGMITTKALTVNAVGGYSTSSDDKTSTAADKDAETLTEWVADGTKSVCTTVGTVVCGWGLICDADQVCEDVINWVLKQVGAASETHPNRSENISSNISFNADIHITGGGDPLLEIDSTGKVVGDDYVTVRDAYGNIVSLGGTISTNSMYVDDILNHGTGSIVMSASGGSTSGTSNIKFDAAFDTVQILNHSNKDLYLNDIEAYNTATPPTITHQATSSNWTYNLSTNATTSDITVTNDSAQDSDITLLGHILNPGGHTTIQNINGGGGDILAVDAYAYIGSRVVSLISDSGRVGADAAHRIFVGLTVSGDGTGYT